MSGIKGLKWEYSPENHAALPFDVNELPAMTFSLKEFAHREEFTIEGSLCVAWVNESESTVTIEYPDEVFTPLNDNSIQSKTTGKIYRFANGGVEVIEPHKP